MSIRFKVNFFILLIFTPFILQTSIADDIDQSDQKALLGQQLFFDTILSKNRTQSCSQCHNPNHGFIDNRDNVVNSMASLGDDGKSLGDRNAPTLTYASFSPEFDFDSKNKDEWIGGQFYDGRQKNLMEQSGEPPLNPIEMAMESKAAVIERLENSKSYNQQFKSIYDEDIFLGVDDAYNAMKESIAEFEKTKQFSTFDSKYDRYLSGEYELNDLEDLGRSLFFSNNNINCSNCHQLKAHEDAKGETFSNYEYHNIGVPINSALRNENGMNSDFIDHGLLLNNFVVYNKHDGKMKVPTLRNVSITAPYMHNGVFQDLTTVILFYDKYVNNERLINPETGKPWREPEISETVNLKALREGKELTERKIDALVAFLNILTDKRYEHLIPKQQ